MTIFEKNIRAISHNQPALADRLRIHNNQSHSFDFAIDIEASEGFWQKNQLTNPIIPIFYGIGCGKHVADYARHTHPYTKRLLVIEKNWNRFVHALHHTDFSDLLERIPSYFIAGLDGIHLRKELNHYFTMTFSLMFSDYLTPIPYLPPFETDSPYYINAAKLVEQVSSEKAKLILHGDPEDNFHGLINTIHNIETISQSHSFDHLRELFKDKPGLVVSTGPSLDHSLEHLRQIQNNVVLFACDSAVPILLKANIRPHFIASIERVFETSTLIADIDPKFQIPYVFPPVTHPQSLKNHQGPKFVLYTQGLRFGFLNENYEHHFCGASAATLAFKGLQILGCNPIALVGQDLAFDRNSNASHASQANTLLLNNGKNEFKEALQKNEKSEDHLGGEIYTTPIFNQFRNCFEIMIQDWDGECYNCIPKHAGQKINGAAQVEPSEFLPKLKTGLNPKKIITEITTTLSPSFHKSDIQNKIEALMKDIRLLQDQTHNAIRDLTHFYLNTCRSSLGTSDWMTYENQLNASFDLALEFIKAPAFYQFIWPFAIRKQMPTLSDYVRTRTKELTSSNKAVFLYRHLMTFHKESLYWMNRIIDLI